MNDRPIPIDAINLHANTQPKAVFSCAMTVMEKMCGKEEEQKWVGSFTAARMRICTKGVSNDEHNCTLDPLGRRMFSIMESVNWVCAEALEEHGCVSPLTVSLKEEEEVLVDLDYQVDFPCVVQWCFCG